MEKFNKFFISNLKRTAQNVSISLRQKNKLVAEIAKKQAELSTIQAQIDAWDAPIKAATGGYGVEDLVTKVVTLSDKVDKNGKPIKETKWVLTYPDTVIPPADDVDGVNGVNFESANTNYAEPAEPSEVSEGVVDDLNSDESIL